MNPQMQQIQQMQAVQQAAIQQQYQQMQQATQPVNPGGWPGLLAGPRPVLGYLGGQLGQGIGAAIGGAATRIPSAFEQALQQFQQYMGGRLSPALQGGIGGGVGRVMGNLLPRQLQQGVSMAPGQPVPVPNFPPAQFHGPIGGQSTGPNQWNFVTPQGHIVGGGGMGIPAPSGFNPGSQPAQANPYLQMLQGLNRGGQLGSPTRPTQY